MPGALYSQHSLQSKRNERQWWKIVAEKKKTVVQHPRNPSSAQRNGNEKKHKTDEHPSRYCWKKKRFFYPIHLILIHLLFLSMGESIASGTPFPNQSMYRTPTRPFVCFSVSLFVPLSVRQIAPPSITFVRYFGRLSVHLFVPPFITWRYGKCLLFVCLLIRPSICPFVFPSVHHLTLHSPLWQSALRKYLRRWGLCPGCRLPPDLPPNNQSAIKKEDKTSIKTKNKELWINIHQEFIGKKGITFVYYRVLPDKGDARKRCSFSTRNAI